MVDLRGEIIAAFSKVPHPGDDHLTDCQCDECRFEVSGFLGRTWMRLATEGPNGHFGAEANLNGLDLPAYHYFLPGILLLALDDEDYSYFLINLTDKLIASDQAPDHDRTRANQLLRRLTERQRQVIIAVIQHREPTPDASPWGQSVLTNLRQGFVTPYSQDAAQNYLADLYGTERFPRASASKGTSP